MDRRWFKTEPGPYEEIDIQLPTTGEPLRVGVAATREPFSFVDKNGRVSGHDGDLARLIAEELGGLRPRGAARPEPADLADEEIARMAKDGPTPAELAKAREQEAANCI